MVYSLWVRPETTRSYGAEVIDGRPDLIRPEDETSDGGWSFVESLENAPHLGKRIKPDHLPTQMVWEAPSSIGVPDLESSYFINVSERAKDLIEQLEPKTHQFFPVAFFSKNEREVIERRFIFVICNRMDGADREHTTMLLWRGKLWRNGRDILGRYPEDVPDDYNLDREMKLVFSEAKLASVHFWRDKHIPNTIFVSNPSVELMQATGLTGVKFHKEQSV